MDRWDVATEVLSTFGSAGVDPITGNTADERGLVENFWWNRLGPDYLAEVFQAAHAADPSGKLFLNESLVELAPTKTQELYDIVADENYKPKPAYFAVWAALHKFGIEPPAG